MLQLKNLVEVTSNYFHCHFFCAHTGHNSYVQSISAEGAWKKSVFCTVFNKMTLILPGVLSLFFLIIDSCLGWCNMPIQGKLKSWEKVYTTPLIIDKSQKQILLICFSLYFSKLKVIQVLILIFFLNFNNLWLVLKVFECPIKQFKVFFYFLIICSNIILSRNITARTTKREHAYRSNG